MRPAHCALVLALVSAAGDARARAPQHESYFSRQLSVQQQQLDPPPDPALLPGQLLVVTPQPYEPPPPPFRPQFAPPP